MITAEIENADQITLQMLKSTRRTLLTTPWKEPDHRELILACERLIRWYGLTDEPFE